MEKDKDYVYADITTDSVDKITALEHELSAELKEDVVLIAYTNQESKE